MKTKHTRGSWRVHNALPLRIMDSAGASIAEVVLWDKKHLAEAEANARLIAAAPELLGLVAKLDTILRGVGPLYAGGEVAAEVQATIAKATGE